MSIEPEIKLTGKQKAFADYYVGEARFVGVNAARLAGYKGKYSALAAIASENLKKPNLKAYIDHRLAALILPANEVIARLTDIANASIEDVVDEDGRFDYDKAKRTGKLPLIKKLKRKTMSPIIEEVEFEMYSAHEALRDLGKYHKLFTEKVELSGTLGFNWSDISKQAKDENNLTDED